MSRLIAFGRQLPPVPQYSSLPDWQQADPAWMARALQFAVGQPGGGWFAVDDCRQFGDRPRRYVIDDRELVFWRGEDGQVRAAPDACPHMGASMSEGCVRRGRLVCPWHGLELGDRPQGHWRPLPVHDDGVLVWVRLDDCGEQPSERPYLPVRPARFIDAVIRMEARCRPEDVLANRLDPWHGVHFHGHTFRRLRVVERREHDITVRVAFKVLGPLVVEVDARFHCPDPRTIVMTIVDGDGAGSVVETHASPVNATHSAVIEATLATSDRQGFRHVQAVARYVRPLIEKRAGRLWVEDLAYAERRRALQDAESGAAPARLRSAG